MFGRLWVLLLMTGCSSEADAVPTDFIGRWSFNAGATQSSECGLPTVDRTGVQFELLPSSTADFDLRMEFDAIGFCTSIFHIHGNTAEGDGGTCGYQIGGSGCTAISVTLTRSPFTLTMRDDGTLAVDEHWDGFVQDGPCHAKPCAGDVMGIASKQ